MAKNKKRTIADAERDLQSIMLDSAVKEGETALARQSATALARTGPAVPSENKDRKAQLKIFREWERQLKENTKTRIWTVDLGGGAIAQVSTELLNWAVRAVGRWSGDGWWARQNDLLQSLPHIIIGALVYIVELATRADPAKVIPSATRAVISEASKLFGNLGFAKLMAAIRGRYVEGQAASLDNAALRAEVERLKALQPKSPK